MTKNKKRSPKHVIPAQAGIQAGIALYRWTPAFAGVTKGAGVTKNKKRSFEESVMPAEAGIPCAVLDPRFRGDDGQMKAEPKHVIPAQAGIQAGIALHHWTPAFAGVTKDKKAVTENKKAEP
jgi:hypothetical protein